MRYRVLLTLTTLLILATLSLIPAFAQDAAFVYIYGGSTQDLVRINLADGAQTTYNLDLGENIYIGGHEIAITHEGTLAAYCTVSYPPDAAQSVASFYVRDIVGQSNILSMDMQQALACRTNRFGFNPDGNQVVVSKINYFPGDTNADTSKPVWEIMVVNAFTGSLLYELNANDPAVNAAGIASGQALMPEIQYFANNQIIFAPVPYATGGVPQVQAYLWQLDNGGVQPIANWGHFGFDTSTTGELIWTEQDTSRPAAEPMGPLPPSNVVKLADKSGQTRTIYYNAEWVTVNTVFIAGDQQIAILLLPANDPNFDPGQKPGKWVALDRMGNVQEIEPAVQYSEITPTANGYTILKLMLDDSSSAPYYILENVQNGQRTLLFENHEQSWELVWHSPVIQAQGLTAFPDA